MLRHLQNMYDGLATWWAAPRCRPSTTGTVAQSPSGSRCCSSTSPLSLAMAWGYGSCAGCVLPGTAMAGAVLAVGGLACIVQVWHGIHLDVPGLLLGICTAAWAAVYYLLSQDAGDSIHPPGLSGLGTCRSSGDPRAAGPSAGTCPGTCSRAMLAPPARERCLAMVARTARPWDRLLVKFRAARLDRDLAVGACPDTTAALALRAQLLVRMSVRRDLARSVQPISAAAARPSRVTPTAGSSLPGPRQGRRRRFQGVNPLPDHARPRPCPGGR